MCFSSRGARLVKALEQFSKDKPIYFDSKNVFNKIKFISANEDRLKGTVVVDQSMCNGYEIMHGGYIATLIDVMCLYAYVAKTNGKLGVTTNLSMNFLSSAPVGEKITAEATSIKYGDDYSIMETVLYKRNGILIAKGTACFKNGREKFQIDCINKLGFDVFKND